jgi:large subunit ribosomal protein L25
VNLQIGGKTQPCLFKDAQYDYLGATLLHLDLARVDLNERVKVHVPIELRGTPAGVKEGGVLRQELKDLEIECLVTHIPENLRVSVENLGLNEVLYARDIELAEGMVTTQDPDSVVATVRPPLVAEEPTETAATEGASAEPEVIAKGKEEAEEGKAEA